MRSNMLLKICLIVGLSLSLSEGYASTLKSNYQRPASIPFPADNPYTVEKAALGKMLFFDPRLSKNRNMTCATCHNPSFGWEDATKTSVGAQNSADLVAATSMVLHIEAEAPAKAEDDNFVFQYSLNGGSFVPVTTLDQGSGRNVFMINLPEQSSGVLTVRVEDSNRTRGTGQTDVLDVFYIAVISNGEPGNMPPVIEVLSPLEVDTFNQGDTVQFNATVLDDKDGDVSNQLQWSSNLDGIIGLGALFSSSQLSVGNHAITAMAADSDSSIGSASVSINITAISSGITLDIRALKEKGVHTPELNWSGISTGFVDVYRDGDLVNSVENTGIFVDTTGNKGGATYVYKVCEQGSNICSDDKSVFY